MNSIRVRLMLIFSVTFLLLLCLLLAVTKMFFYEYYISMNEKTMSTNVEGFRDRLMTEEQQKLLAELKQKTGASIFIYDSELNPIGPQTNPLLDRLGEDYLNDIEHIVMAGEEESYFNVTSDGHGSLMVFAERLPKDELIILTKRTGLADEAVKIFFRFVSITAVVIFLTGIVVTYFITRRLTRPIIKMESVTRKMAGQDFSEKLDVKGSDEINALMGSINRMAEHLSSSIASLNMANEKLAQELSKEQRLETMRRQFVSDVSHELKNPLAMIIAYTDGLNKEIPKTDEQRKDYYNIIFSEANRMNTLVKDLLDLSGYESGTFTIEKSNFIINDLIQESIERFSYITENKKIKVDFEPLINIEVFADRIRLHQVIINLLNNAFKYVDDGGIIQIEISKFDDKMKLLVANSGKLLPDSAFDKVWNSFYQVNTENKGNGLGLAIVRSIVQLHGGRCQAYTSNMMNCFEIIF
ncbi:HAMP domain-containing sensor histidine kinase [Eubacteriaceae bacterium ES3]|nr:HAMP domain-containing sensor histidine kinase [Eubacteriaceae bacterium ES3]